MCSMAGRALSSFTSTAPWSLSGRAEHHLGVSRGRRRRDVKRPGDTLAALAVLSSLTCSSSASRSASETTCRSMAASRVPLKSL